MGFHSKRAAIRNVYYLHLSERSYRSPSSHHPATIDTYSGFKTRKLQLEKERPYGGCWARTLHLVARIMVNLGRKCNKISVVCVV